jgi:hypothetical protein
MVQVDKSTFCGLNVATHRNNKDVSGTDITVKAPLIEEVLVV